MSGKALQETFDGIENYINEAKGFVEQGEIIALSSLEERVQEMCDAIAAMDKEEAAEHKSTLEKLMKELETLQTTLVESRGKLQEELSGVQNHSAASQAYSKSGALAGSKEE